MFSPSRFAAARRSAFLLLIGLLAVAGCAGKGSVSGKVTYDGKPLPFGKLQFQMASGEVVTADISSDGSYSVSNMAPGLAKISVYCVDEEGRIAFAKAMSGATKDPGNLKARPKGRLEDFNKIPEKYFDFSTSGLTYAVKGGSQTHNIDLPK